MGMILIVEDDEAISDLIKLNLEMVGYKVKQIYDGQSALKTIKDEEFDLILLDVMLPIIDGYTIMENINHLDIPVIFLTAKDHLSDRVRGLKMGADDYIIKPFESIELIARVEAVLRRCIKKDELIFKDISIYQEERIVKKNEENIDLTLKEYELLILLVENKGIALSREKILEKVWGYDYIGETRTVDMHIQKLRKKLDLFKEINTVYKVGYRLET